MLREMEPTTVQEWRWYEELEPFGELRMDIRFAHVVGTLINIYRDKKKFPEPIPIADFLLKLDTGADDTPATRKAAKTPAEFRMLAKAITEAHNEGRRTPVVAAPRVRTPKPKS